MDAESRKALIMLSHRLTPDQETELHNRFGVWEIVYLPSELQQRWSHVPPGGELTRELAETFVRFLLDHSAPGDCVVIQGEAGLSFLLADWCLGQERAALYATTVRSTVETRSPDGQTVQKTAIFRHVQFRRYLRVNELTEPMAG